MLLFELNKFCFKHFRYICCLGLYDVCVYIKKSYYIENYCVNTPANFHFSNKILYVLYSASNTYSCIEEYES